MWSRERLSAGVKENQGNLYEDIHDLFEDDQHYNFAGAPYDYAKSVNKDHGRIEIRQFGRSPTLNTWPKFGSRALHGLKSLAMMYRSDGSANKARSKPLLHYQPG